MAEGGKNYWGKPFAVTDCCHDAIISSKLQVRLIRASVAHMVSFNIAAAVCTQTGEIPVLVLRPPHGPRGGPAHDHVQVEGGDHGAGDPETRISCRDQDSSCGQVFFPF